MGTKLYKTSDSKIAWDLLNGVFVIFKPAHTSFTKVRKTIIDRLCQDLNQMRTRPPEKHISIKGTTTSKMEVAVTPSYADNILVVGPRYQSEDVKLSSANFLPRDTSGVVICGVTGGTRLVYKIRESKVTSFYKVTGILGQATDNYFQTGRIVEKSGFKHIKRTHLDNICASMQSSHQRKMYELCGVDIQSQTAYELAAKGLIRPTDKNIPMIYSIKCIHFEPPAFTLEIVCINEYETYLKALIHELGIQLHSTATCTQLQCFQFGPFHINHALLSKYWDLENILHNIITCKEIISKNHHMLQQDDPILVEENSTCEDERAV